MALVLEFLILSLSIFLLFLLIKRNRTPKKACLPPGPVGLPFIGNLHQLGNSNLHEHLWRLSQKHGPLVYLRLGSRPALIVSSAKMAREIMKTRDLEFCSRPFLAATKKLSYNGFDLAFAPYGDYWREVRKICVVHVFSSIRVQSFRSIREDEVSRTIEKISKSALACKPFDLTTEMVSLTSTAISRAAFGKTYEIGGSDTERFLELLVETQAMASSLFLSDYFPCWGWLADKLTGMTYRLEKNFEAFDAFYKRIIDDYLDPNRPKPEREGSTILDILLQIYKDGSFKLQLTLDDIKAILTDIFLAGTDTSAITVNWAMAFLMKNPEAMRKAQEEVRGFVDEDDVQQLLYLKAVVKETMRLQPTVPLLIPRETTKECSIGGYEIPTKTLVYVNVWAVGRDPETWENPYEFDPDRFLGSSIDLKGNDFELTPFGAVLEFLILSLSIFLLFLLIKRNKTTKKACLPPGPDGLPFIGNLHQLGNSILHEHLWRLSQKHGPLVYLRLGSRPALIVSSAKMAREIMKTRDLEFCSRPVLTATNKITYNGLDLAFAPYGDYWREVRKICAVHVFSSIVVQSFRSIREDEVSRMIEKISKSALASKPFNLTTEMVSLTSTAISRAAFGKTYEIGGSDTGRFLELLVETKAMASSLFLSDYFPCWGWLADKLTGLTYRLEKNFEEFDAFYKGIIDDNLDPNRPKPEREGSTILDILLQIYKDGSFKLQLTLDHIKAILTDIFLAGTDTSAVTVVWAMAFLMKNPEAMRKAQEEVRGLFGNKGFVDEDDVQQLPYLKAVVKETMRLQPTVPLLIPRETTKECSIGGYEIPTKTLVYVNVWAVGRDPENWESPFEFDPDRFMGSSIDLKGNDFELTPFGAGRRICPGIFIALFTVELSLANLLHKFDWEMPSGMNREDIDMNDVLPGIAPRMRDDLCLVPKAYATGHK
uniref:Cytochrome P450 n=1 Tax=Salix viminalis TaxID=40686 RepID=A0A6N2KMW6_SALVM